MTRFILWGMLAVAQVPALPCTCVSATGFAPETAIDKYAAVFRGRVLERKELPQRTEMGGRRRYAINFRVDQYWNGSPNRTRILYTMDGGTDCLGGGDYEVGKNYLIYAEEQVVKDQLLDGIFWFGWADVLPAGTHMLVPAMCAPGGTTTQAEIRTIIRKLGRGRTP